MKERNKKIEIPKLFIKYEKKVLRSNLNLLVVVVVDDDDDVRVGERKGRKTNEKSLKQNGFSKKNFFCFFNEMEISNQIQTKTRTIRELYVKTPTFQKQKKNLNHRPNTL